MKREYDSVKLHATVINTNFARVDAKDNQNAESNRLENGRSKVSYFDARRVFQVSIVPPNVGVTTALE